MIHKEGISRTKAPGKEACLEGCRSGMETSVNQGGVISWKSWELLYVGPNRTWKGLSIYHSKRGGKPLKGFEQESDMV